MKLFLPPFLLSVSCACVLAVSSPALADELADLTLRLEALEESVLELGDAAGDTKGVKVSGPTSARADVQVARVEEQVRKLRGAIEELEHAHRALKKRVSVLENEFDTRLKLMEKKFALAAQEGKGFAEVEQPKEESESEVVVKREGATPAKKVLKVPPKPVSIKVEEPFEPVVPAIKNKPKFDDPRAHYDAAFKQLNQKEYNNAAALFSDFVEQYKDNGLVGNAYYWLGEIYYIKGQYTASAEKFREGFQIMPDGPKAPDNLLKLSMSLSRADRKQEACVVLKQLLKKYVGEGTKTIKRKATNESAKLKCDG